MGETLLRLPGPAFTKVLACLDFASIGRVDTAVSDAKLRPTYLAYLAGIGYQLHQSKTYPPVVVRDVRTLEWLAKKSLRIRKLEFAGSEISHDDVIAHQRLFRNVEDLTLTECSQFSDSTVATILEAADERIETLSINGLWKMSVETLDMIGKYCINLQSLSLKYFVIAGHDGYQLAWKAHKLKELRFSTVQISEHILWQVLTRCHGMESLSLVDCDFRRPEMGASVPSPQRLPAFGFPQAQAPHCSIQKLTIFGRKGVLDMPQPLLEGLMQLCRGLEDVNIRGQSFVTDAALRFLAHNASTTLRSLKLDYGDHITDEGICEVAYRCGLLECLMLSECPRITDDSLRALDTCAGLSFLYLGDNERVSYDAYKKLKMRHPESQIYVQRFPPQQDDDDW
jgi:hypothetical protein